MTITNAGRGARGARGRRGRAGRPGNRGGRAPRRVPPRRFGRGRHRAARAAARHRRRDAAADDRHRWDHRRRGAGRRAVRRRERGARSAPRSCSRPRRRRPTPSARCSPSAAPTRVTRAFSGRPGAGIVNRFLAEHPTSRRSPTPRSTTSRVRCAPRRASAATPTRSTCGPGQAHELVQARPAGEIVRQMAADARRDPRSGQRGPARSRYQWRADVAHPADRFVVVVRTASA